MEAVIGANEAHEMQSKTQLERRTLTDTRLMLRNLLVSISRASPREQQLAETDSD